MQPQNIAAEKDFAVDMALCSEVHHRPELVIEKKLKVSADVTAHGAMIRIAFQCL